MTTYNVQLKTGRKYTSKAGVVRVAIALSNGLVCDITEKQFNRWFSGMLPEDTAGVSAMVEFYDKGDVNEITDRVTGEVVKTTVFTDSNKIVSAVDLVRGKVGMETVATALAIQAERKVVSTSDSTAKVRQDFQDLVTMTLTSPEKAEAIIEELESMSPNSAELALMDTIPVAV